MYTDESTGGFPKTLLIRNEYGGCIWQVYHVQKESEAAKLAERATKLLFEDVTLVDYREDLEETAPNWRETAGGKLITE